ncbi:hypothetical protein BH10PSE10_BH10PSE10_26210 [soil metagenome]
MIRFPGALLLLSFAAGAISAPAMAQTQPAQTPATQTPAAQPPAASSKPAAPTCTYSSKTYGDGAFVCVEKSLMLKCTVEDAKAAWSVVGDKDLSDKCRAPAPRGTIYQQRARWNRQNIAREITPPN